MKKHTHQDICCSDRNDATKLIASLASALSWYHLEGQDIALHKKAVPGCNDCRLISEANGYLK